MANHHQSNGTSPAIDVDGAMQATMEGDTQRNDGEVNQEVRKDQTTKEPPIYPWDEEPAWKCTDPPQYPLTNDGKSWERCETLVNDFDRRMCESWREEIQSLLLFAGLFSAVVTSFSVEVSKDLQETPNHITVLLLARISSQLSNSTDILLPDIGSFAYRPGNTVRINVLWSISLTLSLTTVVVGILCLQWIRAYQRRDPAHSVEQTLAVRQARYESLIAWKVPYIISSLPPLLQLALALFLIGLVDYFHSMHPIVGGVLAIFVGLALGIVAVTTILPAIHDTTVYGRWGGNEPRPSCAYRSPQAWSFFRVYSPVATALSAIVLKSFRRSRYFAAVLWSTLSGPPAWPPRSWSAMDEIAIAASNGRELIKGEVWSLHAEPNAVLTWIATTFGRKNPSIARTVYECIHDMQDEPSAWRVSRSLIASFWPGSYDNAGFPKSIDYHGSSKRGSIPLKELSLFQVVQLMDPRVDWPRAANKHYMEYAATDSGLGLDDKLHLHFLELFVRLDTTWQPQDVDDRNVRKWEKHILIKCPSIFANVDVTKVAIPFVPVELRLQLFKCLKSRLDNDRFWDCTSDGMAALLTTLILNPIHPLSPPTCLRPAEESEEATDVPPWRDTTLMMLDAGFASLFNTALRPWPQSPPTRDRRYFDTEDQRRTHFQRCFWLGCIQPLMSRINEQTFLNNKHYLECSKPFHKILDEMRARVTKNEYFMKYRPPQEDQLETWNRFQMLFGREAQA